MHSVGFALLSVSLAALAVGCASDPCSQRRIAMRQQNFDDTVRSIQRREDTGPGRVERAQRAVEDWWRQDAIEFEEGGRTGRRLCLVTRRGRSLRIVSHGPATDIDPGSIMLQCSDCEYFMREAGGRVGFKCDPFTNIKEPECLTKWQLLRSSELTQKMDRLVAAYEATLELYRRMQPIQEKMFRHLEQEIDEAEDADAWKYSDPEDGDAEEDDESRSP